MTLREYKDQVNSAKVESWKSQLVAATRTASRAWEAEAETTPASDRWLSAARHNESRDEMRT